MCQNCTDKKCYKTREPCPELMRYADMDHVKMKETQAKKDVRDDDGISGYKQFEEFEYQRQQERRQEEFEHQEQQKKRHF